MGLVLFGRGSQQAYNCIASELDWDDDTMKYCLIFTTFLTLLLIVGADCIVTPNVNTKIEGAKLRPFSGQSR